MDAKISKLIHNLVLGGAAERSPAKQGCGVWASTKFLEVKWIFFFASIRGSDTAILSPFLSHEYKNIFHVKFWVQIVRYDENYIDVIVQLNSLAD